MSRIRVILGELLYTALFGVLLFVPAGTVDWPKAWVLLAVLVTMRTLGALSVLRVNEDLLVERSKVPIHRGQPGLDKILLPAVMATFAGLVAFNAIDRFHLRLTKEPGAVVSFVGLIAFGLGWA